MRYLINIVLVVISANAFSQKQAKEDTIKNKFLPTGIRIGTDLISIVRSQTDDSFTGYEFSADVDLYRYYLVVEAGRWERSFDGENDQYVNKGNYMRAGIDVNFLTKDPDKNLFFLGMRYGWGTFSENLTTVVVDDLWGQVTEQYTNNDANAGWFELTTGLRVKMWKHFWMGYTARYKFGLSTRETTSLSPHDVPGFGRTDKDATWGFNYQVFFRIPVRKVQ